MLNLASLAEDNPGPTVRTSRVLKRTASTIGRPALYLLWIVSAGVTATFALGLEGKRVVAGVPERHHGLLYVGSPASHPQQVVSEAPGAFFEQLDLRVDFCVDKLDGYADVFQTADVNAGFRLEVDRGGRPFLIVGKPCARDNNECISIRLPRVGSLGRWHSLRIRLDKGSARIDFDGVPYAQRHCLNRVSASRLVLGNGLDGSRPLFGKAVLVQMDARKGLLLPRSRLSKTAVRRGLGLSALVHLLIVALVVTDLRRRAPAATLWRLRLATGSSPNLASVPIAPATSPGRRAA